MNINPGMVKTHDMQIQSPSEPDKIVVLDNVAPESVRRMLIGEPGRIGRVGNLVITIQGSTLTVDDRANELHVMASVVQKLVFYLAERVNTVVYSTPMKSIVFEAPCQTFEDYIWKKIPGKRTQKWIRKTFRRKPPTTST